ncbi:trypsin 3A1-like [Chironomus tepperi]|uniref:trypsin 3A1-like n=1 Tax=Chironomus tepperi TaxID=113505 RepID=UPI00391F197F
MPRLVLTVIIFYLGFCSSYKWEGRILQGSAAQLRQIPYAASIRRVGTLGHVGGGTLISDAWVITAKSVTSLFLRPADLAVALGILNTANTIVAPGMVSTAQAVSEHPVENLALVRIPVVACNAARFGVITPIFLEPRIQSGSFEALVAGWGPTDVNKEPNSLLRFLKITTFTSCTPTSTVRNSIDQLQDSTTICAENTMCTTDVGGPLVTTTGLVGVASSTECGGLDTYVRIHAYRTWISAISGV